MKARRVLRCSHDYQQLPLLNVHQLQHLHQNSWLAVGQSAGSFRNLPLNLTCLAHHLSIHHLEKQNLCD